MQKRALPSGYEVEVLEDPLDVIEREGNEAQMPVWHGNYVQAVMVPAKTVLSWLLIDDR